MGSLALVDVVTPYVLGGAAIGDPLHELVSALFVQEIDTAFDDAGVTIWGIARFSADLTANPPRFTPPASISFGGTANVDHRTARDTNSFWDFPDIAIRFRLTAPRASSPAVDTVIGGPGGAPAAQISSAALGNALARMGQGQPTPGQAAQDAPTTVFHLDLLIDAATLHLPFLRGAKLTPDGMLDDDPANAEVTVTLPKIKLSFEQTAGTSSTDPQMTISLDSFAALDIDDPAGTAFGELISMNPPYALIGPGTALGFGFRSLILDMSSTETPPELKAKFGVGDDFRGIYLPDVRVFVRPPGLEGLGIDVSARELLIGIGPEGGVSGIFGLDVVKPDQPQQVSVSVYDEFGGFIATVPWTDGGAPFTSDVVHVPKKSEIVVDVVGGTPPYTITVDGTVQTTEPVTITIPDGDTHKDVAITVADVHLGGQTRSGTIPLELTAASLTAGQPSSDAQPAKPAVVTAGPAGYTITIEDHANTEDVTLVFTPPDVNHVYVDGSEISVSGGRGSAKLAHGASIAVTADWDVPAVPSTTPKTVTAQFMYDKPASPHPNQADDPDDPAWTQFVVGADNLHSSDSPSKDESSAQPPWTTDDHAFTLSSGWTEWLAAAKAESSAKITLTGMASKEHAPNAAWNIALSQRRIYAIRALLRANGIDVDTRLLPPDAEGEQPPSGALLAPGRGVYRRVILSFPTPVTPATTNHAAISVTRPPKPPVKPPKKHDITERKPAGTDEVRFKELHLRVEIDHNRLIAVELKLKIDVETALESYLSKVKTANPGSVEPAGQGATNLPVGKKADPNDGVLDIRVQLTLDDTVDRWQVVASLFENDSDGFLQTPRPSSSDEGSAVEQYWRTWFGLLIALAPLTDAMAASNTPAGDAVALTVSVGVPFAALALHVVHVPRITFYGGEITVTHDESGTTAALLIDVEVALIVVLTIGSTKIIDTQPDNPITVRYKAVGFKTSDKPQLRDLLPVFDSSKGYSIKIPSSGGIKVPDPLGDILQIAGTRIARSNPANIELDIELKADLGVVSVDKTTIRIPLEGGHAPTISALGVHLSVPGAIDGHGYLAIFEDGFAGELDVSLPSLGIRVAAGLSVRHVVDPNDANHTATGVLVSLEVDFPVPIALGSSGLGIYGFGGLFALHHERNENPNDPVPALSWLTKVHGNPMDITGWQPAIDHWAIGLGAVLGTMDTGFTLNVKGMIIFEMPGPRLLLVMKAQIIKSKPDRKGDTTATILAVIDLDFGRNRLTIGITFDYDVDPLLKVHIPIRAIFPFDDIEHFAIDAGSWYAPATVEFFKLFTARGYFMIRGKGLPDTNGGSDNYDAGHTNDFPLKPVTFGGFAIMTGVSVSFLWGSKSSGLYLSVGASIDVGIGFAPIMFSGKLKLWGELHLWIIGIEASAQLTVVAGRKGDDNVVLIDGEVHGKIDLFFFSIEGSVHVTLGDNPDSPPAPPPLVTGVSLQSRAAALLQGVSSGRPIDGKLVDAHPEGPAPLAEAVPIDAIVVVHLDCTPRLGAGAAFTTTDPDGLVAMAIPAPSGPPAPAVRRGDPYYTYRVKGVSLDHGLTKGATPLVWWPTDPQPTSETKTELALLTRVPDPHPYAVERSKHQEDNLHHIWSTTCDPVAPETSVLWTFHDAPLGPSTVGWMLLGTAWPDPPGSTRSVAPDLRLDVAETWRTGNVAADNLVDIAPARVIGGAVVCDEGCGPTRWPRPPSGPNAVGAGADIALPVVARVGRDVLSLTPVLRDRGVLADLAAPVDAAGVVRPQDGVWAGAKATAQRACFAHVLEAPFLKHSQMVAAQAHPLGQLLSDLAIKAYEQAKAPLDDVVAFRTHEVVVVRMLLDVPALLLHGGALVLRCFDARGLVVDELVVDGHDRSHLVASDGDLPTTWLDLNGPWHCRVREVLEHLTETNRAKRENALRLVLVDTKVDPRTAFVELGVVDTAKLAQEGLHRPSYLVGVVETLTAAEVERHQSDILVKDSKITEINGALDGLPDPPALLLPDTDYTVSVDWEWTTCDANGAVTQPEAWTAATRQTFHFRTDTAPLASTSVTAPGGPTTTMPTRLDPWILLSDPAEGDHFRFWGEPVRVVVSVDYLLDMFETYGVPLQAKVRAASFKNGDPMSPTFLQTYQLLTPSIAKPLKNAVVFSPWEDAVRGLLGDKECVATSGDVSRHQILDLDLLLEPLSEYIFDIELKNPPALAAGEAARPLFRRAFTTSRFRDAHELAGSVAAARFTETPSTDVSGLVALAAAAGPLSASALDAALKQAGLKPVHEVTEPTVEVLWVTIGGVLQPRALVIRTAEPLVRTRQEPDQYEPPGAPRLQRKVITLQDKPYLEVVQTPGVAGAPPMTIVSQPGLNTVVVLVDAGRGAPIDLTLRQHGNAFLGEAPGHTDIELLSVTLDAATWQVVS